MPSQLIGAVDEGGEDVDASAAMNVKDIIKAQVGVDLAIEDQGHK